MVQLRVRVDHGSAQLFLDAGIAGSREFQHATPRAGVVVGAVLYGVYDLFCCRPVHEMRDDEFGETIAPLGSIKEMELQAGQYVQRLRAKKFVENPGILVVMTCGVQIDAALRGCDRGGLVRCSAVCVHACRVGTGGIAVMTW